MWRFAWKIFTLVFIATALAQEQVTVQAVTE
jgi:hypothetical protein